MATLFRHHDGHDELYVMHVDEEFPSLGLHFGCHNPDDHSVVHLQHAQLRILAGVLNAHLAAVDGGAR